MNTIFDDIEFLIAHFGSTDLKHYLNLIRKLSNEELSDLRSIVKKHKKNNRQQLAFANVSNLSSHAAIIAAINHELLKRGIFYPLYNIIFKIRRPIVKAFTGLVLEDNEYFGALYTQPKYISHYYLHMSHKKFLPIFGRFLIRHWRFIVTTVIAIVFGILQLSGGVRLVIVGFDR